MSVIKEKLMAIGLSTAQIDAIITTASQPEALLQPVTTIDKLVSEYARRIPTSDLSLIAYNKFVAIIAVVFVGEHRNIKDAVIPQYFETFINHVVNKTGYDSATVDKSIWASVDIMLKTPNNDTIPVVWSYM